MIIHGRYSYGNPKCKGQQSKVYTGAFCSIADEAIFDCGFQHKQGITTFPIHQKVLNQLVHGHSKGDIHIGNDVWIGENVIVMSGVTIADGVIVGAGTIVTRNLEQPYGVYVGAPAQLKRLRFTPSQIDRLLSLKWWDKPDEWIRQNADLLTSADVEKLLASST